MRNALILLGFPAPAWAQACAEMRPDWTPGTAGSAWNEALALMLSPAGLFLLAATAVALIIRSQWGGLVAVLLWTGFISLITMFPGGPRAAATLEGCVGSPALFIGLAAAICVGTVLYTMPRSADDG
ncbi:MAG: hypothetical protein AAFQ19_10625 [Pseudomonadota bacterium]